MNLYFKIALIWFGGYLLSCIVFFVLVAAICVKVASVKPKFMQYIHSDEVSKKFDDSIERYQLKQTIIGRILETVCWPVTVFLGMMWVKNEFIPLVLACPSGEIEKEDEPEMQITATWDFEDDDKE